jgi:hypothetical protein
MNPYILSTEKQKYYRFNYYSKICKTELSYDEIIVMCENPNKNKRIYPKNRKKATYKYKETFIATYPTPCPNNIIDENDKYIFYKDKVWTKLRDKYLVIHSSKKDGHYCRLNYWNEELKKYEGVKYLIPNNKI